MTIQEDLEPLRINGVEAHPAGPLLYLVRHAATGQELGDIRVCDDRHYEATTKSGSFAGVHKTLAEAMDSLGTGEDPVPGAPTNAAAADPRQPPTPGRGRPVRRGVYVGSLARRNIAP